MDELISIVIPTFNRGKTLLGVLPSYLKQKYVREVIIVDDLSNDDTEELVRAYQSKNDKIKYIKNDKRSGTNKTSNAGLRSTTGKFIFIGEDDVELGDDYLEILMDHMKKENADIISSRRIWVRMGETNQQGLERANKSIGQIIDYRSLLTNFEIMSKDDLELPLLDACMLFKRDVIELVEFDEQLYADPVAWRGESDFQLSAVSAGFKLVFCPHAVCYHRSREARGLIQTIKYDYYAFKNNYFFLKKHKKLINDKLEFKNCFLIYSIGAFVILKGNFFIFSGKIKNFLINIFLSRPSRT